MSLFRKPRLIQVEVEFADGKRPVAVKELTGQQVFDWQEACPKAEDGQYKPDPYLMMIYTCYCPTTDTPLFKFDQVQELRDAPFGTLMPLMNAQNEVNKAIDVDDTKKP